MANNDNPNGPRSDLPYTDYGIIPGIAQAAQQAVYSPALFQAPAFTVEQLAHANWFTTRVHLSPLGKV